MNLFHPFFCHRTVLSFSAQTCLLSLFVISLSLKYATKVEKKSNIAEREYFTRFLESRHLRKTPERFAILDVIASATSHFSLDWLADSLSKTDFRVSKATLYNTIKLLLECKIIRRFQIDSAKNLYERCTSTHALTHIHLVCDGCGKVKVVKDNELLSLLNTKRFSAFSVQYFNINGHGLCNTCARKQRKAAATRKASSSKKAGTTKTSKQ